MAEELTFHLEDFDGPLELLLALVAKHKMDLHNIPILELIDQYTRTVEQADPDPETASAFIEMAAHLVEMKSYLLLPRSERVSDEAGIHRPAHRVRPVPPYGRAAAGKKGSRHRCSCGSRWRWSGTTPIPCTMHPKFWPTTGTPLPGAPACAGSPPSSSLSRWSRPPWCR